MTVLDYMLLLKRKPGEVELKSKVISTASPPSPFSPQE